MDKHSIQEVGQVLEIESDVDKHTALPPLSQRTRMKVDVRLIVTVGIVYALSVIDRINIGSVSTKGDIGERHSMATGKSRGHC